VRDAPYSFQARVRININFKHNNQKQLSNMHPLFHTHVSKNSHLSTGKKAESHEAPFPVDLPHPFTGAEVRFQFGGHTSSGSLMLR